MHATNAYNFLPVVLQNAGITLYGWWFRQKRYKKHYSQYFRKLLSSQWLKKNEFAQMQLQQLNELLLEVKNAVPYYQDKLAGIRLPLKSMDEIREIPFLTKKDIRQSGDLLHNKTRMTKGHFWGHTGGTTGTSLAYPYDWISMQENMAFRDRQYNWAGIRHLNKSVRFSGRALCGRGQKQPFWRFNYAERQMLASSYHMQENNLPYYVEAVKRFAPRYIDGFPSSIYVLARSVLSSKASRGLNLKAVITTSETVLPYQQDMIEKVFRCKVFNFYSSSEGAPFITECSHGSKHFNPESGLVEILRPDGSSCDCGELGEMVVTSFFQRAMPLIRYKIGDFAAFDDRICDCGRQMPVIMELAGRKEDFLYTKERGLVSGTVNADVFKYLGSSVVEAQIRQTDIDVFIVNYVPGELFSSNVFEDVENEMRLRLGHKITIKWKSVPEIQRTAGGKFRAIIGLSQDKLSELAGEIVA